MTFYLELDMELKQIFHNNHTIKYKKNSETYHNTWFIHFIFNELIIPSKLIQKLDQPINKEDLKKHFDVDYFKNSPSQIVLKIKKYLRYCKKQIYLKNLVFKMFKECRSGQNNLLSMATFFVIIFVCFGNEILKDRFLILNFFKLLLKSILNDKKDIKNNISRLKKNLDSRESEDENYLIKLPKNSILSKEQKSSNNIFCKKCKSLFQNQIDFLDKRQKEVSEKKNINKNYKFFENKKSIIRYRENIKNSRVNEVINKNYNFMYSSNSESGTCTIISNETKNNNKLLNLNSNKKNSVISLTIKKSSSNNSIFEKEDNLKENMYIKERKLYLEKRKNKRLEKKMKTDWDFINFKKNINKKKEHLEKSKNSSTIFYFEQININNEANQKIKNSKKFIQSKNHKKINLKSNDNIILSLKSEKNFNFVKNIKKNNRKIVKNLNKESINQLPNENYRGINNDDTSFEKKYQEIENILKNDKDIISNPYEFKFDFPDIEHLKLHINDPIDYNSFQNFLIFDFLNQDLERIEYEQKINNISLRKLKKELTIQSFLHLNPKYQENKEKTFQDSLELEEKKNLKNKNSFKDVFKLKETKEKFIKKYPLRKKMSKKYTGTGNHFLRKKDEMDGIHLNQNTKKSKVTSLISKQSQEQLKIFQNKGLLKRVLQTKINEKCPQKINKNVKQTTFLKVFLKRKTNQ